MRTLRYRGNTYSSPEPISEPARPGARSYRWVKYSVDQPTTATVIPLQSRATQNTSEFELAA